MKAIKSLLTVAIAATGLATAFEAQADRGGYSARPVGGNWSGGSHWRGGSQWGGYRSHWYGPRFGLYLGAPLLWPAYYWGYPYDYNYPRTVIYHEVERYPASYPEGVMMEPPPSTQIAPRMEGAPTKGPLYMNYCESARAYFPKVTTCPEGWKMLPPS